MDEILYELREHSAGLNAGRWDYIFSVIKKFRRHPEFVLPDRARITMTVPFMRAYTELLVRTCHRRGAHAMGGMAAYIPSRRDPEANALALAKVAEDKEREASAGFDGTWVAHPDLVETAMAEFDRVLGDRPNQLDRQRDDVEVSAEQLLDVRVPGGEITEAGLRTNVNVGLRYLASWLSGVGAAAIDNLMEDAATAEISRSQIWQWVEHGAELSSGEPVTADLARSTIETEIASLREELGEASYAELRFDEARAVFERGGARAGVRGVPDAPRLRAALTQVAAGEAAVGHLEHAVQPRRERRRCGWRSGSSRPRRPRGRTPRARAAPTRRPDARSARRRARASATARAPGPRPSAAARRARSPSGSARRGGRSPRSSISSSTRPRSSSSRPCSRAGYSRFSRTLSSSNSPSFCGTTASSSHPGVAERAPLRSIVPASACSHPAITLSNVVLPEPERPTRPTSSPARSVRLTSSSAWTTSSPRR